ncbi:MAG: hypothetical protein IKZ06_03985 [Oscillospiraceae bacterium]|nr:hypothetical protein [Oscillospiraceae bacterium]
MKKLLAVILSVTMLISFCSCGRSKAPSDLYDFLNDDYQAEQTESSSVSEPENEEQEYDPVTKAYIDYIDSYVWVYYLPPEELHSDGNYDMYEWGSYYFYDFNKDGTNELIMIIGTAVFNGRCLIFTYRDGEVSYIDGTECAYGVGVMCIEDSPTIVLCEFYGEYENFTAVTMEMETLYVASNLPVLPNGCVALEPYGIGTDYPGPTTYVPEEDPTNGEEENIGDYEDYFSDDEPYGVGKEWKNPPPEKHFINCAKWEFENTYDCSGMFVESFWIDESNYSAHATVILVVPHTYADERIQVEAVAYYSVEEDRWFSPVVADIVTYMVWNENILGTWVLDGEGLWGGTETVVFELTSIEFSTAFCRYGIGTVENTFGEISYSESYIDGEYIIKEPETMFGIPNCCALSQGRTKHSFYLHPDIGIYYRSGASTNVFPQEMTKAE